MRKFVYNEWSMVEEVIEDGVGTVANTKTYQWGLDLAGSLTATGNVGALLSCTDTSASDTYFYTYDANGNISELVDTIGNIAAHYDYSPFGNLIAKTGTYADANPFRFSTKYQDAITNLLYYGYRYYDSTKGRWINKDPIGERGGINLYGFVSNQVVNTVDVLGRETIESVAKFNSKKGSKNSDNTRDITVIIDYERSCDEYNAVIEVNSVKIKGDTGLGPSVSLGEGISGSSSSSLELTYSTSSKSESCKGKGTILTVTVKFEVHKVITHSVSGGVIVSLGHGVYREKAGSGASGEESITMEYCCCAVP